MCEITVETFINHQTPLEIPKEPGVWFLTGIVRDNEVEKKRVVLQVAQTNNLFKEINRNVSFLKKGDDKENDNKDKSSEKKVFISHFGQELFNYPKSKNRLNYLYGDLFNKYDKLEFHYLELSRGKMILLFIEKYIAYMTGAIYWTHSKPFGGKFEDNKQKCFKEALASKIHLKSTLLDEIDDYLQKEGLL